MFIPPTPGPIAAASTLGIGDNLLLLMGLGALCSVFPLITGYLWANKIGKTIQAKDEASKAELSKTYEELVAEYGKLPSGFSALAPIIVPIILMALSSIVSMAKMSGAFADLLKFLGTPIIALAVGTIFAILQMQGAGKIKEFYAVTEDTLKTVGPILFVTAAGGVLGKVISSSDMVNYIPACGVPLRDGHLLPVHSFRDPQDRAGFLDRCPYNDSRYCSSASAGAGIYNSGADHTRNARDRRRRDDRIARKRLVLLGSYKLW